MTLNKVRLADCCIIKPPKSEAKKLIANNELVSFVPMSNLGIDTPNLLLDADKKLLEVTGSYTYFKDNDVLLAKITPCFENGKLGVAKGLTNSIGFGSSEFIVFRSKGNIIPKYLYYFLLQQSFRDTGKSVMTGAVGHKRVPKDYIENTEISLPSLEIQEIIVNKLDQVFIGVDKAKVNAEKNLKNAMELFESLSLKVFNNRNADWIVKPLGEVVVVERGSSPRPIKKYQTDSDDGVNWIKIGDTKEGAKYVEATKEKITPEGATKSRFVDVGDFILSNSMSFGRPYIMKIQGYIHDGWFVLRLPENINADYFYHLLSSPYLMEQFQSLAAGAVVKNISGDLVKKAILPIPPLEEQKRIANELDKLSKQIEQLKNIYKVKVDSLYELKQSILQKAFNGELA